MRIWRESSMAMDRQRFVAIAGIVGTVPNSPAPAI
jgi:hypothetical protein